MSKIIGVTVGTPLSASSVANSLKGTASGTAVAMKDVSPLEHNIGVKLASKNIVDIKQMLNESLVDNGDGTFTYTRNASMVSASFPLKLKAGTKIKSKAEIISSQNNTENSLCYRVTYADGGIKGYYLSDSKVTLEKDIVGLVIYSYEPNVSFVFKEWQLELGDTATAYTPFADVSTVTLKKCGKNLVDVSQMLNKNLADNGDGTFTYTRASSNYHSEAFPLKLKAGTPIALNMEQISTTDADDRLTCIFIYADGTSKSSYIGRGSATSFTTDKDVVRVQLFSYNAGTAFVFKNFQIELGTTASEYEPYKEPISYNPKADGTVDGVTSLYPTTTLLTDTEGVIISAEYNRDTNKAFAEIYQAIATMGAPVMTIPEEV